MPMWSLCAQLCTRIQVCKSINFIAWNNTCQINDAEPIGNNDGLIESVGNSFVAASTLPKELTGSCKGHDCKVREVCIPQKTTYICVPLLEVFPERRTLPHDCSDIHSASTSGIYKISPTGYEFSVFCDMATADGGWTVSVSKEITIVRQQVGDGWCFRGDWITLRISIGDGLPMKKDLETYSGNFGNKYINAISSGGNYKLYIELEDFDGNKKYAEYNRFSVGDAASNYILRVSGYSGSSTAGDSLLRIHNGMEFSTFNKDNDQLNTGSCAKLRHGAWWYKSCLHSNLNGLYRGGKTNERRDGIVWRSWHGSFYSLKSTKMMIKRN
ncbi:Fibrinogen C domain-containing protein 1-A,Ryncolin-1,Tenascin,Fibrinogen C domain-containing protein 1-B,Fibrinogen C domain-containing protein 1 [Mytilus coruscus]|uniref:Fibrinogen C domain-containing protein 1-A,Ryncolin-1,Tenascin,Fibrinogen C domain-containing protein 1-B,Fibrinogen C domain-containing protein 1 n=1 Tax=Mytilus coruscus TaxID=42192 RepID=A0A6J8A1G1_MYTCO|nr:Fibrinogen C domain-containing protein 1-A,Ryncolin-1,Tenascin,Fibrinogen C domain-containing protein 1-B,Fibrinogen C domain-containing protein 1 [Mytilus coruscus]